GLAQRQQHRAVVVEQRIALARRQPGPAAVGGQDVLAPGLRQHLEEQQVGELGNIVLVGDAVVAQDVAQVPQTLDDVAGGAAAAHAAGFQASSLMSPSRSASLPSNTLFRRFMPPYCAK